MSNFLLSFQCGTTDKVVRLCGCLRDVAFLPLYRVVALRSRSLLNGEPHPMVLFSTVDNAAAGWLIKDAFCRAGVTPFRFVELHTPIDVVIRSYPIASVLYDSKEI